MITSWLVTDWEAQTILRLMGMLDSFNWRQTHDTHTCLTGLRLLNQQKSPLRRPKGGGVGACPPRGFCGRRGGEQRKQGGWEPIIPSRQESHGIWSTLLKRTGLVCTARKRVELHRAGAWLLAAPPPQGNQHRSSECLLRTVYKKKESDIMYCFWSLIHPKFSRAFKHLLLIFLLLICHGFFLSFFSPL